MSSTIRKRQREQVRHERQQEKETRRSQRKTDKPLLPRSVDQEDPDLKGMVPGPQRLRDETDR
ncbi:MAG TPA: hypothetical protein VKP13_09845 [Nitrospira sp.]|nr:hypothetical protein [Nitrospira sp.]